MTDSILDSTKEKLGIVPAETAFDSQIIDHINAAFSTLNDLGVGPAVGYAITDSEDVWDAFLGEDLRLSRVPQYIYLKVKLAFDPPPYSFTQQAFKEQIKEHEYRLMAAVETFPLPVVEEIVLEGGAP
jgi:hypothetical protein